MFGYSNSSYEIARCVTQDLDLLYHRDDLSSDEVRWLMGQSGRHTNATLSQRHRYGQQLPAKNKISTLHHDTEATMTR